MLVWLCLQRRPDKNGDWLTHIYVGTKPYWSVDKAPPVLSSFKSFPSICFQNAANIIISMLSFSYLQELTHLLINTEGKVMELEEQTQNCLYCTEREQRIGGVGVDKDTCPL